MKILYYTIGTLTATKPTFILKNSFDNYTSNLDEAKKFKSSIGAIVDICLNLNIYPQFYNSIKIIEVWIAEDNNKLFFKYHEKDNNSTDKYNSFFKYHHHQNHEYHEYFEEV